MSRKRSYTLHKRAAAQEETRRRIVEAAVALHEEIGPRATTISAIAARAGVQRLTVYRHFPDDAAVFQACSSHWLDLHPLPDPAGWRTIAPAPARTRAALAAFYRYYRSTERMWTGAYRDLPLLPALQGPMADFDSAVRAVGEGLVAALGPSPGPALAATVHHALAFSTWASLKAEGLDDARMAALACRWIVSARAGDAPARTGKKRAIASGRGPSMAERDQIAATRPSSRS